MFQDTLLIIKPDYLHKRRPVLLMLLQNGFQIQTRRRINVTPEQAAEFYSECEEEKSFMLQVILLSKGISEAFILAKEQAVDELLNTLICYFTTSMEMERNVHASKTVADVRREIPFIFPNYIHEPIPFLDKYTFCKSHNIKDFIEELYEILKGDEESKKNWRQSLAMWMYKTNKDLPEITNICSRKPITGFEEKGVQVFIPEEKKVCITEALAEAPVSAASTLTVSSVGSSVLGTSSSCMSCTGFAGNDVCLEPPKDTPLGELIKSRTQDLPRQDEEPPMTICDVVWHEVSEHGSEEDMGLEAESEDWDQFMDNVSIDKGEPDNDATPAIVVETADKAEPPAEGDAPK